MLQTVLLFLFLAAAAYLDCVSRRIPNWLTVAMAVTGLAVSAAMGWPMLRLSLLGMAAGLIIGVVIWLLGGFKAGDAKLIAATGAVAGIQPLPGILAWTFVAAALIGLVYLVCKKELRSRMTRVWRHFKGVVLQRRISPYAPNPADKDVPFAIFLLGGAVLAFAIPIK